MCVNWLNEAFGTLFSTAWLANISIIITFRFVYTCETIVWAADTYPVSCSVHKRIFIYSFYAYWSKKTQSNNAVVKHVSVSQKTHQSNGQPVNVAQQEVSLPATVFKPKEDKVSNFLLEIKVLVRWWPLFCTDTDADRPESSAGKEEQEKS